MRLILTNNMLMPIPSYTDRPKWRPMLTTEHQKAEKGCYKLPMSYYNTLKAIKRSIILQ